MNLRHLVSIFDNVRDSGSSPFPFSPPVLRFLSSPLTRSLEQATKLLASAYYKLKKERCWATEEIRKQLDDSPVGWKQTPLTPPPPFKQAIVTVATYTPKNRHLNCHATFHKEKRVTTQGPTNNTLRHPFFSNLLTSASKWNSVYILFCQHDVSYESWMHYEVSSMSLCSTRTTF